MECGDWSPLSFMRPRDALKGRVGADFVGGSQKESDDKSSHSKGALRPRALEAARWGKLTSPKRKNYMERRDFVAMLAAGGVTAFRTRGLLGTDQENGYVRANTDWLAQCRFGIGIHWTAQTAPRHGPPLPFQKAVDAFDVQKFMGQFVKSGADLNASE